MHNQVTGVERSDLVQQSHVGGGLRRVHTQEPEAGQSATSSSWSAAGAAAAAGH